MRLTYRVLSYNKDKGAISQDANTLKEARLVFTQFFKANGCAILEKQSWDEHKFLSASCLQRKGEFPIDPNE